MPTKRRINKREARIGWAVKRRADKWLAVIFVAEAPVTVGTLPTKSEARIVARQSASEFRHK